MRKMHYYCPRCNEPNLSVSTPGRTATETTPRIVIKCHECGWRAVVDLPLTIDGFEKAVASVVRTGDDAGA